MLERNLLRDKTLVLRILDERLQSHLRDKIAKLEDHVNKHSKSSSSTNNQQQQSNNNNHVNGPQQAATPASASTEQAARIFDLEGVTCEPAIQSQTSSSIPSSFSPSEKAEKEIHLLDEHTLFTFHCDGATYPARLTNLPCPIELHKTHDHAMYYKCVDVAQMLIVYEDMTALEEAESTPGYSYRIEGYPSYYHSGLTPPMTKVVQRRYMQREHHCDAKSKPPMSEVMEVEKFLDALIDSISTKDPNKRVGRGNHSAQRSMQTKVLEEVEDEIVDFEPWMGGRDGNGIEFDENDAICKQHPEVWLDAEESKMQMQMPSMSMSASVSMSASGATSGVTSASGATSVASSKEKEKGKEKKKKDAKKKTKTGTTKKSKKDKSKKAAETVSTQKPKPILAPSPVPPPVSASVSASASASASASVLDESVSDVKIMTTADLDTIDFDLDLDLGGDDEFDLMDLGDLQ